MSQKDEQESRRGTLKVLIGVGSAAFACALAAPAAIFVAAPLQKKRKDGTRWVRTVRADTVRDDEPKKVTIVADLTDAWTISKNVELGAVWLVRKGGEVLALSVICPHLGCSVNFAPEGEGFRCPCHTSAFSAEGKRISGPSPRDMDMLATKIENDFVYVDFRKFRQGISERVEVG